MSRLEKLCKFANGSILDGISALACEILVASLCKKYYAFDGYIRDTALLFNINLYPTMRYKKESEFSSLSERKYHRKYSNAIVQARSLQSSSNCISYTIDLLLVVVRTISHIRRTSTTIFFTGPAWRSHILVYIEIVNIFNSFLV